MWRCREPASQTGIRPAQSDRNFVIALSDFGVAELGPAILDIRRHRAPGISVSFVDFHQHDFNPLVSRSIDFAWLARFHLDDLDSASIRALPLQHYRQVALFDAQHPLAALTELTSDDLRRWPLIRLDPEPGIFKPKRLQELKGVECFEIAVALEHVTLMPQLLQNSLCWALVPENLALREAPHFDLTQRAVPFLDLPDIDVCLAWSTVHDVDPAHLWFRETLAACFRR